MIADYISMRQWNWIERSTGQKCSEFGRKVAYIVGVVGYGIYNAPINHRKVEWSSTSSIQVVWYGEMATHDFDQLTWLTLLAHHLGVRVSVRGHTAKYLLLIFQPRIKGENRYTTGHPDVEQVVEFFRKYFPKDTVPSELADPIPSEQK